MDQVIQVVGALLILAAFALSQLDRLTPDSLSYLVLNALGSGILAVDALSDEQWGFVLLEAVWCLVSIYGLTRFWGARRNAATARRR